MKFLGGVVILKLLEIVAENFSGTTPFGPHVLHVPLGQIDWSDIRADLT